MSSAYKEALEEIATGLARRAHAERVLTSHVQEADRIIEVAGKARRDFWWCQEMEMVAGGFLIGIVPSSKEWITSCCTAIFGSYAWIGPVSSGATVAIAFAGVILLCHSWLRSIGIFLHHADALPRPKAASALASSANALSCGINPVAEQPEQPALNPETE